MLLGCLHNHSWIEIQLRLGILEKGIGAFPVHADGSDRQLRSPVLPAIMLQQSPQAYGLAYVLGHPYYGKTSILGYIIKKIRYHNRKDSASRIQRQSSA